MKIIILMLGCCLFSIGAAGQTMVYYGYDANGNMLKRSLSPGRKAALGTSTDTLGADPLAKYKVSVYPNPVQIKINIEVQNLPSDLLSTYKVYNLNGSVITKGNINAPLESTDFSSYQTGIYMLRISIGNEYRIFKIIKE